MTDVEKIQELVPQFYFTVMNNTNIIDNLLLEIISLDIPKNPKNIKNRIRFANFFEKLGFHNKIELVKIILQTNYPDIFQKYPNYFQELSDVKEFRDSIAHLPIHFERDSNEQHAKLVFHHRIIANQKRLTKRRMEGIMKTVKKCTDDTRKIFTLVGKTKDLRF